jgi:hypothetical protein
MKTFLEWLFYGGRRDRKSATREIERGDTAFELNAALTLSSGGAYTCAHTGYGYSVSECSGQLPRSIAVAGIAPHPFQFSMVVKSHRQLRHEREHNELADWLAERIDAVRPYSTQITIGVVGVVLIILAGAYYLSTQRQVTTQEWADYFAALDDRAPEQALQDLYASKPNSPAALWAAQTLGDINLAQGAALMFSDREQAKNKLEAAQDYYKKAEVAPNDLNLVARARLGLGKVNEALCQPDEALKYYKLVAETQKGTALGKAGEKAVKRMENPRDVALLAWFAQQTPKKPAPLPGAGGGLPGLPNDLPDRPDITPPLGLGLDNIGTGVPDAPEPTLPKPSPAPAPATPDAPNPDAGKPAPPSPGTPAPTEKPADAKPK